MSDTIKLDSAAAVEVAEAWMPAPRWPQYEVSSSGKVRRYGRILRPQRSTRGYLYYSLCVKCEKRRVAAHRHQNRDGSIGGLVAETASVAATAYLGEEARVYGEARVCGNALVCGDAQVYDDARVCGVALHRGAVTRAAALEAVLDANPILEQDK